MTHFSRVPADKASEFSGIATTHAIPHEMIQFDEDEKNVVFQFRGSREKGAFDHYVREETGFDVEVHTPTLNMVDAVNEGADPKDILDTICEAKNGKFELVNKMSGITVGRADSISDAKKLAVKKSKLLNRKIKVYDGSGKWMFDAEGSTIIKS